MPRVTFLQTNFGGGEFSPRLGGRVDTARYKTGLNLLSNYVPIIQGPLVRRSGTYFVAEVKDSTKATRLINFEFSTAQAYIIESGNLYFRFYRSNGQIADTNRTITGVTQANPAVVSAAGHVYPNGVTVTISGVVGMTELNSNSYTVANTDHAAGTFELSGINSTGYGAYTSDGTTTRDVAAPYEIISPYLEADLPRLRFTQSADVLFITHPSYAPRKLSRTGHTTWTLTEIEFEDGPYLTTNRTTTTLTPSHATGAGRTLTASAITGINTDTGFQSTDVGRFIRLKQGTKWGWVKIVGYTSATVVTIDIQETLTTTGAKVTWRLGVWSETTGFPALVTFYEDRLMFAGATEYPQRLDGSNSSEYENFAPTDLDGAVTDANAVAFTLNANQVNQIRWMITDEKGLLVGTSGGEWIVRPSSQGEALSATNITAKQTTTYGSADVQAVPAGKSVVFAQRSHRRVRELRYFFSADGFEAPDLTLLADHMPTGGIQEFARQEEPRSIIWARRADGQLLGMTYSRDAEVVKVGWHRHPLGGVSDASGTDPLVESIAVIPAPDASRAEVWLIAQRWVNGAAVRYIEYITKEFTDDMPQEDAFFVDCGLSYDGVSTTTVSGLDHLEGETLGVLADGAVRPDVVVSSGSITLATAASTIHVGYNYNSDGQMLRVEAGSSDGAALSKQRRTHRVGLLVHRTLGLKIGMNFDEMDELTFRTSTDLSGQAPALFSGIINENLDADYDYENMFSWRQDQPLPGTILAIAPRMHLQDT